MKTAVDIFYERIKMLNGDSKYLERTYEHCKELEKNDLKFAFKTEQDICSEQDAEDFYNLHFNN